MANLFYEISGVANTPLDLSRSCTSLVARRANGTVYLGRNQDYPPPFTLVMTHVTWRKNGKSLFEGTTFAGTIGVATGMSHPGRWAVSINARDNPEQGKPKGIERAIAAANNGAFIFPILMRHALQTLSGGYPEAKAYISAAPLIMPGYVVLGGINAPGAHGQGAIITRNMSIGIARDTDIYELNDAAAGTQGPAGGTWMVVQTNTDHWVKAPIYPGTNPPISRRAMAVKQLDAVGQARVDLNGLWHVLSTPPTYNAATIHTELVAPEWLEYQTWKRHGPLE